MSDGQYAMEVAEKMMRVISDTMQKIEEAVTKNKITPCEPDPDIESFLGSTTGKVLVVIVDTMGGCSNTSGNGQGARTCFKNLHKKSAFCHDQRI